MGRSSQVTSLPQSPFSDSDHEEGSANIHAKQKARRRLTRLYKKKRRYQLSPLKEVQAPEYRLVQDLLNLSNWRLGSKTGDAGTFIDSSSRVLNNILCFWSAFAGKTDEMDALIKARQLRMRRAHSRMHGMRFMRDILHAGSCSEQWNYEKMRNERPIAALLAMESGKLLHTFARVCVFIKLIRRLYTTIICFAVISNGLDRHAVLLTDSPGYLFHLNRRCDPVFLT